MRAYYNDNDPFVCQWLRNLIDAKLIMAGDVDERSIKEVVADDVRDYTRVHFFAGIGGWDLALRTARWPEERRVWTGSCPCQPFSVAGDQRGFEDPRHLWPQFKRLIKDCTPSVVFGEQVANAPEWLSLVRSDLEEMDYAMGVFPIEAASCHADHFRDRYWFVADRYEQCQEDGQLQRGREQCWPSGDTKSDVRPVADGDGDGERSQIQVGESSDIRAECSTLTGDCVRDVGNLPSERGDWGANSPEQAGWFSAEIADCGGRYYIECPDGKWRRLPPPRVRWLGIGISARVAKLRALGNAIDHRPAVAFISAYLDIVNEHRP